MSTDSDGSEFSCEHCGETFERQQDLDEHVAEAHGSAEESTGESESVDENEDAAAAGSDAAGSTGSITEETNDSPSAAEPSEAAGPAGIDDDVRPDTDDEDDDR